MKNVEAVRILNEQEFLAVYKSGEDTYDLARFDFQNGAPLQQLTHETPAWNEYPYRLWDGVAIEHSERYIICNFKPNEIAIFDK